MRLGVEAAKVEAAGVADMCRVLGRTRVVFASLKDGDSLRNGAGKDRVL
jgi:hypothetical protein